MATQTLEVTITVELSADMVESDFGVPMSPMWVDPENVKIEGVHIGDERYEVSVLPDWLCEHIIDNSDDDEWM